MEQYTKGKPQLLTFLILSCMILAGSLTVLTLRALDKAQISDLVEQWQAETPKFTSCSRLCDNKDIQINQTCCDQTYIQCATKQFCYDQKMRMFQTNIEEDILAMIYTSIPAGFAIIAVSVIVLVWVRLRKKAVQQTQVNAIQQTLLVYDDDPMIGDIDEESFESYEDFIQYLLDQGYIIPDLLDSKKRGDPKITDSFGTTDNDNCPICIMEYSEEKVLKLRCEHKFHSKCIRDWNQANPSCPVCRADIYE